MSLNINLIQESGSFSFVNQFELPQYQQRQSINDVKLGILLDQKRKIKDQLTQLRQQELRIKANASKPIRYLQHSQVYQDPQKYEDAQHLIERLNAQKQVYTEKKKQIDTKIRLKLEREAELETQMKRLQLDQYTQLKRESILQKIKINKQRLERNRRIHQESNAIIKMINYTQLDQIKKSRYAQIEGLNLTQASKSKSKSKFQISEIQRHQEDYARRKKKWAIRAQKIQLAPIFHYENKWSQILRSQQIAKIKQERQKHQTKMLNISRRQKYGLLANQLFKDQHKLLPKREQSQAKSRAKSVILRRSLPSINSSIAVRQQQKRQDRKNYVRVSKLVRKSNKQQDEQKSIPTRKKKYINYLQSMPRHHSRSNTTQQWMTISRDNTISKEQKIQRLRQNAQLLQSKAATKQTYMRGYATKLFISSMKAKLALLEQI